MTCPSHAANSCRAGIPIPVATVSSLLKFKCERPGLKLSHSEEDSSHASEEPFGKSHLGQVAHSHTLCTFPTAPGVTCLPCSAWALLPGKSRGSPPGRRTSSTSSLETRVAAHLHLNTIPSASQAVKFEQHCPGQLPCPAAQGPVGQCCHS